MSKAKAKEAGKTPSGRPTKRTEAVIEEICSRLASGELMASICRDDHMPHVSQVWRWQQDDENLLQRITRAREHGVDVLVLEALEIADEASKDTVETRWGPKPDKEWIARSKLRVETRLKLAAKLHPKQYGDRIAQEISGPDGGPVRQQVEQRTPEDMAKFAEILAKAEKELPK